MRITHKEYPLAVVADSLDPPQIRKSGYHITNLIAEGLAISQGKRAAPYTGDDSGLMAMGRIWEPSVRPWLSEYCSYLGYTVEYATQDKPLEVWIGDILGNLDAKVWDGDRLVAIVDMKFTTGNPDFTQKHQNMHQFKAYCYSVMSDIASDDVQKVILDTISLAAIPEFWILILHMPHKGKPEARFYVDVLEFEQEELDATWKLIVDTREYLEQSKDCGEK